MEKNENKFKTVLKNFAANTKVFLKKQVAKTKLWLKKQTFLTVSVLVIFFAALFSLIMTPIHVDALYRIYSQISGFAMFTFVLAGLVCLFCSTRLKKGVLNSIMAMFFLILTSVLGIWLVSIYVDAIHNQQNIPEESILALKKAVALTISIIVLYAASFVLLVCNLFKLSMDSKKTAMEQNSSNK